MKPRIGLFIVCVLLLIPMAATPTTAVRCFLPYVNESLPERVSRELQSSTAVFSGKVIAAEYRPVKNFTENQGGMEELVVIISANRWWKGDGREDVEMYTTFTKAPNGMITFMAEDFQFQVGKDYLVYASGNPDRLQTSVCYLTREIEQAAEQLRILGEGETPKRKIQ